MHLFLLLPCLFIAFLKCVSASGSDWCYTTCPQTPQEWPKLPGSFCGNKRQSPINITRSSVMKDDHLGKFMFVNFTSEHVITKLTNTGHTVKYHLMDGEVEVSGGGLNGTYSSLQFHFHWGDAEHRMGSEHTIDGHRYPMEMHIVSVKKGKTVNQAKEDPEGIAALGFFINVTEDEDMSAPWDNLTSYITSEKDTDVNITDSISLNDLIGDVNLTKYYRYMGSLTTPLCNEAVVWTVFEEPIKISKKLIQRFPTKAGYTDVYRPIQPLNERQVYASPAVHLPPAGHWCYDKDCDFSPSLWQNLPNSFCGGSRQSPVNIVTEKAEENKNLDDFRYKKFEYKHAIKYMINTGHAVKCVLKDNMVEVSEGGLGHVYTTLQFHFHWGTTSDDSVGSEHTVDSKRYPMEMHIVNKRKDLTLEEAVKTPNGLAVLGFFIEAAKGDKFRSSDHHEEPSHTDEGPWHKLTNYLSAIRNISSKVEVKHEISIDDLLGDVNRHQYYRYNGSLTTPSCNEAVVWTVFKESIKVDPSLLKKFPAMVGYSDVFRPVQDQKSRKIYKTSAAAAPGPAILVLLLAFYCSFSAIFHL